MSGINSQKIKVWENSENKFHFLQELNLVDKNTQVKVKATELGQNIPWSETAGENTLFEVTFTRKNNPLMAKMGLSPEVTYLVSAFDLGSGLFNHDYLVENRLQRVAEHSQELHEVFMNQTHPGAGNAFGDVVADRIVDLLGHPTFQEYFPAVISAYKHAIFDHVIRI